MIGDETATHTNWNYGTAGFRGPSDSLHDLFFKVGIFASLRALTLQGPIGLMITASHNPPHDNGIKIVDPDCGIMAQEDESSLTLFVNSPLGHISFPQSSPQAILIGHDSRQSCGLLLKPLLEAISQSPNNVILVGLTTTPCLHYSVLGHTRPQWRPEKAISLYLTTFLDPFVSACSLLPTSSSSVYVDCANGVPTLILDHPTIKSLPHLQISLRNCAINQPDCLNVGCGADFVKTRQRRPCNFDDLEHEKCASFDGDADRVVYFSPRAEGDVLLDGDRILCLLVRFFRELIDAAGVEGCRLGAVQTAYANGASSLYIREVLLVEVFVVSTGVKHLVRKAKELDLGVYFEANGHGSVFFSADLLERVRMVARKPESTEGQAWAARLLLHSCDVVNPTIGDALSAMLLTEIALKYFGWSVDDWLAQYDQLPSRLLQVTVRDRFAYVTGDAERRLVSHAELQDKIDAVVGAADGGRSFVRPSGTEDVVRIYAEARTEEDVEAIADAVAQLVRSDDELNCRSLN